MSELVNFDTLDLQITEFIKSYPLEQQREIFDYLNEMDDINKKAYKIAYDHLKSSFSIVRSNGFNNWKKSKESSK